MKDKNIGNTGGLGGVFGIFYAIGYGGAGASHASGPHAPPPLSGSTRGTRWKPWCLLIHAEASLSVSLSLSLALYFCQAQRYTLLVGYAGWHQPVCDKNGMRWAEEWSNVSPSTPACRFLRGNPRRRASGFVLSWRSTSSRTWLSSTRRTGSPSSRPSEMTKFPAERLTESFSRAGATRLTAPWLV